MIKINDFQGELTDISAKKEALFLIIAQMLHSLYCDTHAHQ